ncbi:porin family protein [Bacteroides sp. OttesenSCG-928-D19]|nr:porin family protein [Bacteroides sp. OttesenSCG-928-D19]
MKKLLLMVVVSLTTMGLFAQKDSKAVGVNLGYGTEISNLGLGAKFQYGITDAIRAEASFDYFLKKDFLSMWDLNANVHYLFPVAEKFKVYPLAGLTFTNWKMHGFDLGLDYGDWGDYLDDEDFEDDSSSTGKFGINLGAGVEYELTEKLTLSFEAKYQLISDFNQLVFGVGVAYKF